MQNDARQHDNDVASGSTCPTPECGALALAYGRFDGAELCEFTCPRCGIQFIASPDSLIFRSVPKKWLLAQVQTA